MLKTPLILAAAVLAATLAACAATGDKPVDVGPVITVRGEAPASLYARIARQVKKCWLNPADPVLERHVFHAEAAAGDKSEGAVNISIHERTPDGKRGLRAYTIDFEPLRGGTRIVTRNHRIDYALGQKMSADVGFWAQGATMCEG